MKKIISSLIALILTTTAFSQTTPQMKKANDWAVEKYASWGISARNEQWGEWKGWERGITHIDMLFPRVKSLEGTQLSWSPSTKGKSVKAEIVIIPDVADSLA